MSKLPYLKHYINIFYPIWFSDKDIQYLFVENAKRKKKKDVSEKTHPISFSVMTSRLLNLLAIHFLTFNLQFRPDANIL